MLDLTAKTRSILRTDRWTTFIKFNSAPAVFRDHGLAVLDRTWPPCITKWIFLWAGSGLDSSASCLLTSRISSSVCRIRSFNWRECAAGAGSRGLKDVVGQKVEMSLGYPSHVSPGGPLPLLLQADCYEFRVLLHLGKHLSLALDHNLGVSHQLTQVLPGCRVLTMPWCFNWLMAFSFLLHHTYNLFGLGPRCSKLSGSVSLSAEIMHT